MRRVDDPTAQIESPEDSAIRNLGSVNNSFYTDVVERLHHRKGTALQQLAALKSMSQLKDTWGVRGLRNAKINYKIDREGRGYYNLHYSPGPSQYRYDPIDITLEYEEIGDECNVYINGRKAFSFARSNPAEITLASNCRAEEATELLLDFKAGLSQALHEHDGELEEIETSFDASQKERIAGALIQLEGDGGFLWILLLDIVLRRSKLFMERSPERLKSGLSTAKTLNDMGIKINLSRLLPDLQKPLSEASKKAEGWVFESDLLEQEREEPDGMGVQTGIIAKLRVAIHKVLGRNQPSQPPEKIEETKQKFDRIKTEILMILSELRDELAELEDPNLGELLSNDLFVSSVVRILEASRATRQKE